MRRAQGAWRVPRPTGGLAAAAARTTRGDPPEIGDGRRRAQGAWAAPGATTPTQRPSTSTYSAAGDWCSTRTGPSGAERRCATTRGGAPADNAPGATFPDAIGRGYI